jgi:hypothetical protein
MPSAMAMQGALCDDRSDPSASEDQFSVFSVFLLTNYNVHVLVEDQEKSGGETSNVWRRNLEENHYWRIWRNLEENHYWRIWRNLEEEQVKSGGEIWRRITTGGSGEIWRRNK